MRFRAELLEHYPGVNIGVLKGTGLVIRPCDPGLQTVKAEALRSALEKLGDAPATRHPFVASWRELYRSFGTKPADYRPSAEALLRRAQKGVGLPTINTAVDAYNAVSLRHLVPMGGFDLDKVVGEIALRVSKGGERFTPLGPAVVEETYQGEAVYADGNRILTRRWNYRDCEETKITVETRNVAMFIDGAPEIPLQVVEAALDDLETMLEKFCGGTYAKAVANSGRHFIEL